MCLTRAPEAYLRWLYGSEYLYFAISLISGENSILEMG